MIDWVPRHTVDCSAVPAQNGDGLIPPHVEDVDLGSKSVSFIKGLRVHDSYFIVIVNGQLTFMSSEPDATKDWSRPPKQLWIV